MLRRPQSASQAVRPIQMQIQTTNTNSKYKQQIQIQIQIQMQGVIKMLRRSQSHAKQLRDDDNDGNDSLFIRLFFRGNDGSK